MFERSMQIRMTPAWRLFLTFNAAFWGAAFLLFTVQASLQSAPEQWNLAFRRAALVLWGFSFTSLAHAVFERVSTGFSWRARWAAFTTPALALICTCAFYFVYHVWRPAPGAPPIALDGSGALSDYIVANYPFHLVLWSSWVGLYLAFHYAQEINARERALVLAAAQAQRAELLMLRYQINPHFLFNTLNAISAQIMTGHSREADDMLTALSRFLRHSLAHSDVTQTPLVDELATQELYLSIEKTRFRDRLSVSIDVEPGLSDALTPSFILQPLTENAMKHAVAPLNRTVHIAISAKRAANRLHLQVRDDGPGAANNNAPGLGAGLVNVRARLQGLYGEDALLKANALASGGFCVDITLPLKFASVERAA